MNREGSIEQQHLWKQQTTATKHTTHKKQQNKQHTTHGERAERVRAGTVGREAAVVEGWRTREKRQNQQQQQQQNEEPIGKQQQQQQKDWQETKAKQATTEIRTNTKTSCKRSTVYKENVYKHRLAR